MNGRKNTREKIGGTRKKKQISRSDAIIRRSMVKQAYINKYVEGKKQHPFRLE